LDFPALLLDLEPLPVRVLEVFPQRPPLSPKRSGSTLVALASPPERSRLCRNIAASNRGPKPCSASRGLARFHPFAVLPDASTPGEAACRSSPFTFGPGRPVPTRVPPSWFLTTSTVFSAPGPAGLLRPACGLEVRRVADLASLRAPVETGNRRGTRGLSRDCTTLRRVPLASSRTASLQPLPSCRCRRSQCSGSPRRTPTSTSHAVGRSLLRPSTSSRLQGLAPLTSPLSPSSRCRPDALAPPMGFLPFEVLRAPMPSTPRRAEARRRGGNALPRRAAARRRRFRRGQRTGRSLPRFATSPRRVGRAAGVCPERESRRAEARHGPPWGS
jgi:hypothetical protein